MSSLAVGIKKVAIITKSNSVEAEEAARRIIGILQSKEIQTYSIVPFSEHGCVSLSPDNLKDLDLDMVMAVGGDGTTLRSFNLIHCGTPLFSINVGGHRGILSEATINSIDDSLDSILKKKYVCESRLRIQASINDKMIARPALNEIVCSRRNLTRTPVFTIEMMNDEISQRMDGIIVSTPTGSTGHSFSIGGSVLHEDLECLTLVPIASVNRMPQLVVPVQQINIMCSQDTSLIVDGQEIFDIIAGQRIKITRHSSDAQFVRLKKRGMRQLKKLGF
ncbi:MAG: NAD(+)/NADH kinase [Nitrososphaeraceae archaeon]